MPLANPNLPYKIGDYTYATLPHLPHGNYPPGTEANTADEGPVFVSAAGTIYKWIKVRIGADDYAIPAIKITP